MSHPSRAPRLPRRGSAAASLPPIVERPDGYYWVGDGDLGEFGPFESYEAARIDRDGGSEEALSPAETLRDAEREIGGPAWPEPPDAAPGDDDSPHLREE